MRGILNLLDKGRSIEVVLALAEVAEVKVKVEAEEIVKMTMNLKFTQVGPFLKIRICKEISMV